MLDESGDDELFCYAIKAIISINILFKKDNMLFNAKLYVHLSIHSTLIQ